MAVPKRKTAKARRDKRRTHYTASPVAVVACPNCKEPKPPCTRENSTLPLRKP